MNYQNNYVERSN